jgi:uncharacterized protein YycO
MNTLYFRCISSSGLVSSAIKFWTWSEWTHCEIYTKDGWLGAQTDGKGVAVRPFNYTTPKAQALFSIELPNYDLAMEFAYKQLGKPYDYTAILGMIAREPLAENPLKWFCSDYLAAVTRKGGINLLHGEGVYRFTPRDIYISPLPTPIVSIPCL